MTKKKPTTKRRLDTSSLRRSLETTMQHAYNLDAYEAYCTGYARAAQHNDVADLVLPFSCAHTAAAFCLGLEHGAKKMSLCRLDDLVDAVTAYTTQPSSK